uniref:Uncharacterized protein LOC104250100 n=1 Tax=Nicotiana sylvestris TaxID=4096 RepID=A0A1U7Z0P2_NICSY|nr:PREDICTED: uncharacterized protein LOC104250100 [Nicotiana sylvestris]
MENNMATAARKLTYSAGFGEEKQTMADVVKGNRTVFESIDDKMLIMANYTFNNRQMMLKNWEPDFEIDKEHMRVMPLWVTFSGLHIQCWAEENLGRITNCLEKPVCTDRLTAQCERILYARVLIEMDITQPLLDELTIEQPNGKIRVQRVDHEQKPVFCQECNRFGHPNGECKRGSQPGMQRKKDKRHKWVRKTKADENE